MLNFNLELFFSFYNLTLYEIGRIKLNLLIQSILFKIQSF